MTAANEGECLIWPVHKRVCGPRANPFLWPVLSQKEADDAVDNLDYSIDDPDAPNFPSLRVYLKARLSVPDDIAPIFVRSLQDDEAIPDIGMERKHKQSFLPEVRYIEMQRLDEVQMKTHQDVLDVMHLASMASRNVIEFGVEPNTWQSGFLHRILVLQQLFLSAVSGAAYKPAASGYIGGAVDRVVRYVRDPHKEVEAGKVRAAKGAVDRNMETWMLFAANVRAPRS
ncbi:hypothetical protein JCM3770_004170 [Rhodotorula araucariae]